MEKTPKNIQHIFNKISQYYDFMNNIISLCTHKFIKTKCAEMLDIPQRARVLDLCCGTGDTAWIIKRLYKRSNVIGVDFSDKMLDIARKKCKYVEFYNLDISKLPFEKCSFDTITCTFGLRNVENIETVLENISKILRHGGEFMQLDFAYKNFFSKIFDFYLLTMAKLLKKNLVAYKYLVDSKKEFPKPEELIKICEKYSLKLKTKRDFFFGIISMQIYTK